ncbi:MAG: hypothetical protein IJ379_08770 [Lachnospiraceae bacterium]|nr:hypothetical protein [Lachnospiraceae bacterium]
MKEKIPTVEEIIEFKEAVQNMSVEERQEFGCYNDRRKITMRETMAEPLMRHAKEESKEDVWKLCKKLSNFSHAPVSRAEYKKMEIYSSDCNMIDTVLAALQECYYPFEGQLLPDIMGYYYCIALVSQAMYRREDCLVYLEDLCNYFLENLPEKTDVLKRNMKVLGKEYADLMPLYNKLDAGV